MNRIDKKFLQLRASSGCALVSYICAGDPDLPTSQIMLEDLPAAGVDIIELGVPFLDPAGDGPIIENAAKRAVAGGMTVAKVLVMVENFRKKNDTTPIILMGYYNSFLKYGLDKFFLDADKSGVDGVLIVDLPPQENEILEYINQTNIAQINLISPLTDEKRIIEIAKNSKGFLYLISMLGITGTKLADAESNKINVKKIRQNCNLPIVIGFGIQTPKQAKEFSQIGVDGVVVGSAIVKEINDNFLAQKSASEIAKNTLQKVAEFSQAILSK